MQQHKKKITVLYPIEVPNGIYCWEHDVMYGGVCEHFDNEGGHPKCDFGFMSDTAYCSLERTEKGVLKPPICLSFMRQKNQDEK